MRAAHRCLVPVFRGRGSVRHHARVGTSVTRSVGHGHLLLQVRWELHHLLLLLLLHHHLLLLLGHHAHSWLNTHTHLL